MNVTLFETDISNMIELITVMKTRLTVKEVATFLQKDISDIIELSQHISAMFPLRGDDVTSEENMYFTVFHKSVLDWLHNKKRSGGLSNTKESYYIDPKHAHNYFVERLLLQLDKNNNNDIEWKFPEEKNSYLINHLLDHLDAAGRILESKQLLMSLPWMMKTIEERGVSVLIGEFKSRLINNNNNKIENDEFDVAFKMVMGALQLSHDILSKNGQNFPKRLPIQLFGRLNGLLLKNPFLQTLRESFKNWFSQFLLFQPKRLYLEAPGGSLENKFQFKVSLSVLVYI